ncbi:MAG: cell division protein FtsX [Candidatus Aminicenantales bacterium]
MVVFFLKKDAAPAEKDAIETALKNSSLVTRVQFVSSQKAMERFLGKFPELQDIVKNLETNPFPPSFEVTLKEKNFTYQQTQPFIQNIRQLSGIEDVQFNREWVEKMRSLSRLARAVGFFLGGILVLASFFIVSNVIKLNVFARKDEIEILRLVGGTNFFIRIPFLTEGVILGVLGGALSLLLLFLIIRLFPFYLGSSLGVLNELVNFRYLTFAQCLAMILSGALIGLLGSLSSLAKFLKS